MNGGGFHNVSMAAVVSSSPGKPDQVLVDADQLRHVAAKRRLGLGAVGSLVAALLQPPAAVRLPGLPVERLPGRTRPILVDADEPQRPGLRPRRRRCAEPVAPLRGDVPRPVLHATPRGSSTSGRYLRTASGTHRRQSEASSPRPTSGACSSPFGIASQSTQRRDESIRPRPRDAETRLASGFRPVRWRGLEPPRPIQATRPSTLRVYQFRHQRRQRAQRTAERLCEPSTARSRGSPR